VLYSAAPRERKVSPPVKPLCHLETNWGRALRDLSLAHATLAAAGSVGFLLLSAGVFYRGLRRYESGNLLAMRE